MMIMMIISKRSHDQNKTWLNEWMDKYIYDCFVHRCNVIYWWWWWWSRSVKQINEKKTTTYWTQIHKYTSKICVCVCLDFFLLPLIMVYQLFVNDNKLMKKKQETLLSIYYVYKILSSSMTIGHLLICDRYRHIYIEGERER